MAISLELISWKPHSSLERERKIRRRLFRRRNRAVTAKKCTKTRDARVKMLCRLIKLLLLTFSLHGN